MHGCGMGIHADLVEPAKVVMMAKWLVVAEILYAFNLAWTKLSLLLMYNRIFGAGVPSFRPMSIAVGCKLSYSQKPIIRAFLTSPF